MTDTRRLDAAAGEMDRAAIVPKHQITEAPFMAVDELGPDLMFE